jgi:hypothetical protein
MLPETLSTFLQQQGTQFDFRAKQDQAVRDLLGTLPKNATDEQLRQRGAQLSRLGINPAIIEGWRNPMMAVRGKARADAITSAQNAAIGSAGLATRIPGPPGPSGEPQTFSLGEINRAAGGVPTGVPIGAAASGEAMVRDQGRAGNFGQEMFPLEQASRKIDELKAKYGEGFFGPGSKGRQDFEGYFYALSPTIARYAGIDPQKLKNYAEADKYLTQALQTRAAGLGAHTDQQLATTISGNPNVHINDLAVDDVLKGLIAARRAEHAQTLESAKRGGPVNYLTESSSWPARNDIRAFTLDLLPPDQRAKLLGSIKKGTPEYERFNNSLRSAYDTGVMTRPGAEPPPLPGARKGVDVDGSRKWFIPDPNRPGKQLRIDLPKIGG